MKTLLPALMLLTLFSCSKDPAEPTPASNATGSVQYKVNGQLVVMDNVDLAAGQYALFYKRIFNNITWYELNAQKSTSNVIEFSVGTDSLHETRYFTDSTGNATFAPMSMFNGQLSSLVYSGDYFDLNISSYKNGRISGTFSGKLTDESVSLDYNNRGTILITEGKITNVQVVY